MIAKINTGKRVGVQEQMFVLMYSMAGDTKETKDEMKSLREDFKKFNDCLHSLTELVDELRVETAFIKGTILERKD